jgi:hypothetical protein
MNTIAAKAAEMFGQDKSASGCRADDIVARWDWGQQRGCGGHGVQFKGLILRMDLQNRLPTDGWRHSTAYILYRGMYRDKNLSFCLVLDGGGTWHLYRSRVCKDLLERGQTLMTKLRLSRWEELCLG